MLEGESGQLIDGGIDSKIDSGVRGILNEALAGRAPGREQCEALLGFHERTIEANLTRAVADTLSRRRFGNQAMLLGQIGIETFACPARCGFCVFGEGHTQFPETRLSLDQIIEQAEGLAGGGDLYALFLMTMHTFEIDRLTSIVAGVRKALPLQTQIVVNIGDFDRQQAEALKAAGVDGAYHVQRLREGDDTVLDPAERLRTIDAVREADLDWYYCCEPLGPEHTPTEIVDQLMLGVERGCFQHAAMRRVWLDHSPLAQRGQISELRLGQITAVVSLASGACAETTTIAVHEPNLIGLTSGANVVYAEAGANPRDTSTDTRDHRGLDIIGARRMLYEAGFTAIRRGDGSTSPLNERTIDPACV
ncbi:hypothetical protein HED60_14190 [Planctomycetales bacterium ZRK34]|nr:hypothetical protein HED60_14190 [Planctomycetales bacterium ZRK34]